MAQTKKKARYHFGKKNSKTVLFQTVNALITACTEVVVPPLDVQLRATTDFLSVFSAQARRSSSRRRRSRRMSGQQQPPSDAVVHEEAGEEAQLAPKPAATAGGPAEATAEAAEASSDPAATAELWTAVQDPPPLTEADLKLEQFENAVRLRAQLREQASSLEESNSREQQQDPYWLEKTEAIKRESSFKNRLEREAAESKAADEARARRERERAAELEVETQEKILKDTKRQSMLRGVTLLPLDPELPPLPPPGTESAEEILASLSQLARLDDLQESAEFYSEPEEGEGAGYN